METQGIMTEFQGQTVSANQSEGAFVGSLDDYEEEKEEDDGYKSTCGRGRTIKGPLLVNLLVLSVDGIGRVKELV